MSRASAGLLHACDATRCTAVAFTAEVEVPPGWVRREAVADGVGHTDRARVEVDLCDAHVDWCSGHEPVLPGLMQSTAVGDMLVLLQSVACAGCTWSVRQKLPVGSAEDRNAFLVDVWLGHLAPSSDLAEEPTAVAAATTAEDTPIPASAVTPMTDFLSRLLRTHQDSQLVFDDTLIDAVHGHAAVLRSDDAARVIPEMISAAQALTAVRKALEAAERAAREEIDAALDDLGADPTTATVDGKPVYVTGLDGRRYRVARGHTTKTGFRDDPVTALVGAALRMDYRPPEGTPTHLSGIFGDEFEAGVTAGVAAARAAIGGAWKSGDLTRHAHRLARAGDTTSAGLLEAARYRTTSRRETARFESVSDHRTAQLASSTP